MQPNLDTKRSSQPTTSSIEPAHPWILGIVTTDDGPRSQRSGIPYSFVSECECPDDCLRDHGNE